MYQVSNETAKKIGLPMEEEHKEDCSYFDCSLDLNVKLARNELNLEKKE